MQYASLAWGMANPVSSNFKATAIEEC